jgi:hypothetical protein
MRRCRLFGHRWRSVDGGYRIPDWFVGIAAIHDFRCTRCEVVRSLDQIAFVQPAPAHRAEESE